MTDRQQRYHTHQSECQMQTPVFVLPSVNRFNLLRGILRRGDHACSEKSEFEIRRMENFLGVDRKKITDLEESWLGIYSSRPKLLHDDCVKVKTKEGKKQPSFGKRETTMELSIQNTSTSRKLRKELDRSLQKIDSCSGKVKKEVLSYHRYYRPSVQSKEARIRFKDLHRNLQLWAMETVIQFSAQRVLLQSRYFLQHWKHVSDNLKFLGQVRKYMKYQSIANMDIICMAWRRKQVAHSWVCWITYVNQIRLLEQLEREQQAVKAIQGVQRVYAAKCFRRALSQKKRDSAAIVLARSVRCWIPRQQYHEILQREHAVIRIQIAYRSKAARCTLTFLRQDKVENVSSIHIQKTLRRLSAQVTLKRQLKERFLNKNAAFMQRFARGLLARNRAKSKATERKLTRASTCIQKYSRRHVHQREVRTLRARGAQERLMRVQFALLLQKVYRGHRGRVSTKIELAVLIMINRKRNWAISVVQGFARRLRSSRKVQRQWNEVYEAMIASAREWQEEWSAEANAWYYYNAFESRWEPPQSGYTKADSRLVLKTGKVINDLLTTREGVAIETCVACEHAPASKHCEQCGINYCYLCFASAHGKGGRREGHTFHHIGPVSCEECGETLAVQWCVQCDDPFCAVCWDKVHQKGNRVLHGYCKIDSDGNVSPRAWTHDGRPDGVYPRVDLTEEDEPAQISTTGEEQHNNEQFYNTFTGAYAIG